MYILNKMVIQIGKSAWESRYTLHPGKIIYSYRSQKASKSYLYKIQHQRSSGHVILFQKRAKEKKERTTVAKQTPSPAKQNPLELSLNSNASRLHSLPFRSTEVASSPMTASWAAPPTSAVASYLLPKPKRGQIDWHRLIIPALRRLGKNAKSRSAWLGYNETMSLKKKKGGEKEENKTERQGGWKPRSQPFLNEDEPAPELWDRSDYLLTLNHSQILVPLSKGRHFYSQAVPFPRAQRAQHWQPSSISPYVLFPSPHLSAKVTA